MPGDSESVEEGMMADAYKDRILELHRQGMKPWQIAGQIRKKNLHTEAIVKLIAKYATENPSLLESRGGDDNSARGSQETTSQDTTEPDEHEEEHSQPVTPPTQPEQPSRPSTPPEERRTPPTRPPPPAREPASYPVNSTGMSDVAPAPMPSPMSGAYEVGTTEGVLMQIMTELTVEAPQARGVLRAFKHYKPDDYRQLQTILSRYPKIIPSIKTAVVENYRLEMEGTGEDRSGLSIGATADEKLRSVEGKLGLDKSISADPMENEVDTLEREERKLRIEIAKAELARRKRDMTPGTPSGEDDEYMDIVINVGGMPMPKRIRASQLPMWQPYIPKPQDAHPVTPPEDPEKKAFREELERRRADEQRAKDAKIDRLEQMVTQLTQGGGPNRGPSERERILDEENRRLRDEQDRKADMAALEARHSSQINSLRADFARATQDPSFVAEQQRKFENIARERGMVPKGEVGALTEQQIDLRAREKALSRQDEAKGGLYEVAKGKLEDTGQLKKAIVESGLPKVVVDAISKRLQSPDEQRAIAEQPTDAQLQEHIRRMEQQQEHK